MWLSLGKISTVEGKMAEKWAVVAADPERRWIYAS